MQARRKPEELSAEERQELHRAHQRLRNASQALESLTVVEPVRGRWVANPAPLEVLEAAQAELHEACQGVWRAQRELLCWEPSGTTATDQ
ncbi:MAG: hypothetical protein M3291_11125 [Actinomycetota bacterium]|nr:hypothetical protein [Actinomycetota bacterium]